MQLQLTVQQTFLSLATAIQEFMLHQRSSGHSPCTLRHYQNSLGHLGTSLEAQGVQDFEAIRPVHLRQFLIELADRYKPKTVHGIATDIRALFSFHLRENEISNPMAKVDMPKQPQEILPAFDKEEVGKLITATGGRDVLSVRNRLLVLLLLDSGVRLCELAPIKRGDVDPQSGIFKVVGKGRKDRLTRLSPTTLKALNKYLRFHPGGEADPLWLGKYGPLTYHGLAEVVQKIGERAGVHAHPHKFRRTCALTMLRAGADLFSVQHLLGHSDLTVLRRYLAMNQDDYLRVHTLYSPVQALSS